jgi:hypothetical protein
MATDESRFSAAGINRVSLLRFTSGDKLEDRRIGESVVIRATHVIAARGAEQLAAMAHKTFSAIGANIAVVLCQRRLRTYRLTI